MRKYCMMLSGALLLGIGAAFLKGVGMGSDPFNTMIFGLSDYFSVSFTVAFFCVNVVLLLIVLKVKRSLMGVASLLIMFGLGPVVEITLFLLPDQPESMWVRLAMLTIGLFALSLGCAFCLTANLGVAPYDALAPILEDRLRRSFQLCRILTDCICVAVGMLVGATPGIATLIVALGLGPIIGFFLRHVAQPWLAGAPKAAPIFR